MELNKLQLMRSTEYRLLGDIIVHQPTLNEIASFSDDGKGYEKFMMLVNTMILTPADIADILWVENQIIYTDFASDWDFFISRAFSDGEDIEIKEMYEGEIIINTGRCANAIVEQAINYFFNRKGHYVFITDNQNVGKEVPSVIYLLNVGDNGEIIDDGFKFGEPLYHLLVKFLNTITWNNGVPFFMQELKSKNPSSNIKIGNKRLLKALLESAYKKRNSKQKNSVTFDSIVSALIAEQHNNEQIWNFPLYLVYDQYYRISKIKTYSETMAALNSGCYDTKKHPINWEKIDWASVINI